MFKRFIIVVLLFFIGFWSAQASYHLGIEAFERAEYQKAFDLMKPIAEKGGTYVVAYVKHIRDNKLIPDAEFQLPVEIPQSIRQTSDDWLKASLLYIQIRDALEGYVYAPGSVMKGKKRKKSKKKSKKRLELPGNTLKKLKSLHSMRDNKNYRAAILIGELIKCRAYLLNADFIKEESVLSYYKGLIHCFSSIGYLMYPELVRIIYECKKIEKNKGPIDTYLYYLAWAKKNQDYESCLIQLNNELLNKTMLDESGFLALNKKGSVVKNIYACILRKENLGELYFQGALENNCELFRPAFESGHTNVADRFFTHPLFSECEYWNKYCYDIMQKLHSENPSSPIDYAVILDEGIGGKVKKGEALRWAETAYNNGEKLALRILCRLYSCKTFEGRDDVKARELTLKAIKLDNRASDMILYAELLRGGRGGDVDYAQAFTWAKTAYELGSINASGLLGTMYNDGNGVQKDLEQARYFYKEYLEKKENLGSDLDIYAVLCYSYACMCFNGEGGVVDYVETFEYAHKAYKLGELGAGDMLASLYYNGHKCSKDLKKARKLFKEQADKFQDGSSSYNYALMCFSGEGGALNFVDAYKYTSIAFELNENLAVLLFAELHGKGLGVKKDLPKARELYIKAMNIPSTVAYFCYAQFCLQEDSDLDINEVIRICREGLEKEPESAYYQFCFADVLWDVFKKDENSVDKQELSDSINKAICMGSAEALMLKRQFDQYNRRKLRLMQQELNVAESGEDSESDEDESQDVIEIKFPDLEDSNLDDVDDSSEDESPAASEDLSNRQEEAAVLSVSEQENMMKGQKAQWAEDRKRKKSKKYRQWCEQSIEANQQQLHNNRIDGMENNRLFILPPKLDIGLLYAVFSMKRYKFHNYTSRDAMKLFESFGCNVGVNGESFHIEYQDKKGVIHKFSTHNSHGHGKENKLYRPTNLYLKRFCNTIGLTQKVIEGYQA